MSIEQDINNLEISLFMFKFHHKLLVAIETAMANNPP